MTGREDLRLPGDSQKPPPQPIAFGKYTLLERISHGGMAEVFRARFGEEGGFEHIVAIKLLLPQVASDQEFVTMMIDEAKIAGQLNHANIAQIFDLGELDGRYYIVQEFVHGRDLRTILRNTTERGQKLYPPLSLHVVLKMCEGLDYAHNKRDVSGRSLNLVHRDISPQNVIVSYDGEVKLIDFGIVKAEGRQTQTLAGLVKGKFAYMSPEQLRGLPVDRRSDVFACGIVLHELLTGHPLFKRSSDFETLRRARSGDIEPPSQMNPHIPPDLDQIALKALARHVDDRYQTADDLRDALWQFVRSSGQLYSREELSEWMHKTFPQPAASPPSAVSKPVVVPKPGVVPTPGLASSSARTAPRPVPKVREVYAPPPRLDYDDSDEGTDEGSDGDPDHLTIVDPGLQARFLGDENAGSSTTLPVAAQEDDDDFGRPTAPLGTPAVRALARAAQNEPERAVFSAGDDARHPEIDALGPSTEERTVPLAPRSWVEPVTPLMPTRSRPRPVLDHEPESDRATRVGGPNDDGPVTSPFNPRMRRPDLGHAPTSRPHAPILTAEGRPATPAEPLRAHADTEPQTPPSGTPIGASPQVTFRPPGTVPPPVGPSPSPMPGPLRAESPMLRAQSPMPGPPMAMGPYGMPGYPPGAIPSPMPGPAPSPMPGSYTYGEPPPRSRRMLVLVVAACVVLAAAGTISIILSASG